MASQQYINRRTSRHRAQRTGVNETPSIFIRRVNKDGRRRAAILLEGDSWFAYPYGNIAACLEKHVIKRNSYANICCCAKNGDTAINMTKSPGSKEVINILRNCGHNLDFILLSAGGNDIAGKDLLKFTVPYQPGFTAANCLNNAFDDKLKEVAGKYRALLDYLKRRSIRTNIITHSYAYIEPMKKGVPILCLEYGKGWIKQYLDRRGIPQDVQRELVKLMLDRFHNELLGITAEYPNFHVLDYRDGVLTPGDKKHWKDEMHPTPKGFKMLSRHFVSKMRTLDSRIPNMRA